MQEAVDFLMDQYRNNLKSKQMEKQKLLDMLFSKEEYTRNELSNQLDEMQKVVKQHFHDKIYLKIEPQIIKL